MIGWWITVAAAAAVAVLFAVAGVIFKQVFTRKEPKQFGGDEPCLAPKWSEIEAEIAEGVRKIRGGRLEKITVNSFDGLQLAGRYFAPEGRLRGVVICAHGYHSNYGNDFGAVTDFYHTRGFGLLYIDQRAHGESEGRYLCFGIKERHDIKSWAYYAYGRFGGDVPLFLDGLSMGAASVLMAAGEKLPLTVKGIIADCGFTSLKEEIAHVMRKHHVMPWLLLPPLNVWTRLCAGFWLGEYSTLDAMKRNRLPVLLIHGGAADFVPTYMSRENYDVCIAEKELVIVEGAPHAIARLADREKTEAALLRFLRQNLPKTAGAFTEC